AGAAVSVALVCVIRLVRNARERPIEQFGWPAAAGVLVGGIAAPACAWLGILVARIVPTASWTVEYPESWRDNILLFCKPDHRWINDDQFSRVIATWPLELL